MSSNIKAMTRCLRHRGPDDFGEWVDDSAKIALGHARLAIIDLSSLGRQPMSSHDARYVISFNGEIYNFKELRKSLEKEGYKFKGGTDTEVILEAIDRFGLEKAVKSFIGMFSFAIFDKKKRVLHLVRDRMGIKPLYYGWAKDGAFIFGSELKALMAYPNFDRNISLCSLSLFFRHNYIPAPFTIFNDAHKLLPGSILTLDEKSLREKSPKIMAFWSTRQIWRECKENKFKLSEEEAINELYGLLSDSVRIRLIADVPVGAFLSGGIDSNLVVSIMQSISSIPTKTFSIGFYDKEYNEAHYAAKIANILGTDHTELYVTPQDSLNIIQDLPFFWDEPFADSSQIPTFLLSRLTRRHVAVSLSGDGGDELFGGYTRYQIAPNLWKIISFFPFFIRKKASFIIKNFSDNRLDFLGFLAGRFGKRIGFGSMIKRLSELLNIKEFPEFYGMLCSHFMPFGELVKGKDNIAPFFKELKLEPNKASYPDYLDIMCLCDLLTYLPDDILAKVDRASMANGLEARVPFLDHRVVKFALSLPDSLKIRNNKGKWICRRILERYIPKELFERPKMGFGVPIGTWLRNELSDWANSLIQEADKDVKEYLCWDKVLKIWSFHRDGKANYQYVLWNILVFLAWHDKWKK